MKKKAAGHLKLALIETAPSWPPGSMRTYAELVGSALFDEKRIKVQRIDLSPPVGLARSIPALRGIWGRHLWAKLFGPLKIRNVGADIYHILDGGYAYIGNFGAIHPLVITTHDVIPLLQAKEMFPVEKPSVMSLRIIEQNLKGLKRANHIIADSKNTRQDLIQFGEIKDSKITTVPLTINQKYADISKRREGKAWNERRQNDPSFILNVANNGYYKNRIGALKIFCLIRNTRNISLKMVGPPPTTEMIDLIERKGIQRSVDFVIDPDNERLSALYASAALLLFPSLYEGFGWPPLEAMLFGCPVVCSNAASLPEVVGEAALTAPPGDSEALAKLCAKILDDESLANDLIAKGHQQVEKFSLERMREGILAAYGECLRDRGLRSEVRDLRSGGRGLRSEKR